MNRKIKLGDLAAGAIVGCIFTILCQIGIAWWTRPTPQPPGPIDVESPILVKEGTPFVVLPAKTRGGSSVLWVEWKGPSKQIIETIDPSHCVWAPSTPLKKGQVYELHAIASVDGSPYVEIVQIVVGERPPPGPTPPEPEPEPEPEPPAPIPEQGLHVLVIYESQNGKPVIDGSQWYALNSSQVLEYLNTHARGNWRIWDKDVPTKDEAEVWQKAMERAKSKQNKLPWVIVSNGKTGFEGPLPMTKPEIMALFQKYTPGS